VARRLYPAILALEEASVGRPSESGVGSGRPPPPVVFRELRQSTVFMRRPSHVDPAFDTVIAVRQFKGLMTMAASCKHLKLPNLNRTELSNWGEKPGQAARLAAEPGQFAEPPRIYSVGPFLALGSSE
jgi:hypothetical protein